MEYLKLQTNIPVEVAFKYTTGKEVDSKNFTDQAGLPKKQKMFTLVDGRVMYLDLYPAGKIEEQLAAQQIGSGEYVSLCKAEVKQGNQRGIQYQVQRRDPPTNGNGANGSGKPPAPPAVSQPSNASPNQQTNGSASNGHAPSSQPSAVSNQPSKLAAALITAVDAVVATRKHAAAIGFTLPDDLSWEDLRALAATAIISADKNGGPR